MKTKIIIILLLVGLTFLFYKLYKKEKSQIKHISAFTYEYSHPSVKMYYCLKKYSKMYDIPEEYAFAIAYQETKYKGPLHNEYQWFQTSSAGALGPMQIIPYYGKIYGKKFLNKELTDDDINYNIETNIHISMLMLRDFKNQYGDWKMAFGAYNTGKPIINQYAIDVYNKEYDWVK